MKLKALKITDNTLFVYKQVKQNSNRSETDTTTTITSMTTTTGMFNSAKGLR